MRLVLALVLLPSLGAGQGFPVYEATILTQTPGVGYHAIGDGGVAAGSSFDRAITWDPVRGRRDLPLPPGRTNANGYGINASGQVTGYASADRVGRHPFVYDPATDTSRLVGEFQARAEAADISDAGHITGIQDIPELGFSLGFRIDPDGTQHLLDRLYLDQGGVAPVAVNASGWAAGSFGGWTRPSGALVWREDGSVFEIPPMPGTLFMLSADINDLGWVVGRGSSDGWAYNAHTGEMRELPHPALPQFGGGPEAINDRFEVVGRTRDETRGYGYYYRDGVGAAYMEDLLLPSQRPHVSDLILWDINDHGQIVGEGKWDGQYTSFVFNPVPEPGLLAALALGLAALARRRRKG
ncbi:MAG: PEP-CTERM sorting domain-containing protein [Fimbriimonadaceae bacterium]|nr:PEP-CTERM sorting domain-containing protein [Fimbriimonadaceae bacterium]